MIFKDNVKRSFKLARQDIENLRADHLKLRDGSHDWIMYLDHKNKELRKRIDELEAKLCHLENPGNAKHY